MWTLRVTNFRIEILDLEGVPRNDFVVPNEKAEIAEAIFFLDCVASFLPAAEDVLTSYSYDLLTELAEEMDIHWSIEESLSLEVDSERV